MTKIIAETWNSGWLMRIPLFLTVPLWFLNILAAAGALTNNPPDYQVALGFFVNGFGFFLFFYMIGWGLTRIKMFYYYLKAPK